MSILFPFRSVIPISINVWLILFKYISANICIRTRIAVRICDVFIQVCTLSGSAFFGVFVGQLMTQNRVRTRRDARVPRSNKSYAFNVRHISLLPFF